MKYNISVEIKAGALTVRAYFLVSGSTGGWVQYMSSKKLKLKKQRSTNMAYSHIQNRLGCMSCQHDTLMNFSHITMMYVITNHEALLYIMKAYIALLHEQE